MHKAPSFNRDIRQLFTAQDRAAMRSSFDLWEVASVRQHAAAILDQVAAGRMPCTAPGPPSRSSCSAGGSRPAAQTDQAAYDRKFSQ